jgi:DNA-binding response OmpR family regulator
LEDDADVREELNEFLVMRGHTVHAIGDLCAFQTLMKEGPALDAAVIDVMLPDGEGFEAVQQIREESQRTGIVLLTARGGIQDRLRGLQMGSDHYLVKPISLIELGAIIDALLRRVGLDWQFDATLKQLRSPEGCVLDLNVFESCLFDLLCSSQEAAVSREALIQAMGYEWADADLRRLDTAISRLRSNWREADNRSLPLKTLYGRGYSFSQPLRKI